MIKKLGTGEIDMTAKERVHAALRREPVDRVPIYMWYHPETAKQLGKLLEIPPERVAEALGDDIRQTWVSGNFAMEGIVHEHEGEGHMDFWGIDWVRIGYFNQIRQCPLEKASREQILQYRYPYEHIDALLQQMQRVLPYADDHFIGCDISPCLFEQVYRLRGMENALMDLVANPDISKDMLQKAADFAFVLAERVCDELAIDWLWTGDDVAGQQNLMMSPEMWREMVKPHLARIVAVAKERGIWSAHHCCGALRPIIPDLIEIGVDVLNPVQGTCPGMDPYELKREFGKDLAFMGGIDTQHLLPHGTEEAVYAETVRMLEAMTADGGGYILAASHTVPHETPLENVFAMYRAAGVTREEIFDRAAGIRAG